MVGKTDVLVMEMDKEMNIIYPFVSIIIPSYNRSKLITITLDSLLEQTYPHDRYEIIVVDNKSTDETPSIVKQYEKETEGRVRYFYEGRQGSHYARNNVVKYAKGELLYFTDDDMQTDARALEELVIEGITTNGDFDYLVLHHPDFIKGKYNVGFVEEHLDELLAWDALVESDEPHEEMDGPV